MAKLMNIGFGNMVNTDKIVCIVSSDSAPAKRMVQKGKEQENLIDATQGRRTKSVIFTENNKIILSALRPETLAADLMAMPQRYMMIRKNRGILTVVSGFSGSGKGTIMKELMKNMLTAMHYPFRRRQEIQDRVKRMVWNIFPHKRAV